MFNIVSVSQSLLTCTMFKFIFVYLVRCLIHNKPKHLYHIFHNTNLFLILHLECISHLILPFCLITTILSSSLLICLTPLLYISPFLPNLPYPLLLPTPSLHNTFPPFLLPFLGPRVAAHPRKNLISVPLRSQFGPCYEIMSLTGRSIYWTRSQLT